MKKKNKEVEVVLKNLITTLNLELDYCEQAHGEVKNKQFSKGYMQSLKDTIETVSSYLEKCSICKKCKRTLVEGRCIAKDCVKIKKDDVSQLDLYIKECVAIVQDIYSDTYAVLSEIGEKVKNKDLIEALTEGAMEQLEFRKKIKAPIKDYARLERLVRKEIKKRYF